MRRPSCYGLAVTISAGPRVLIVGGSGFIGAAAAAAAVREGWTVATLARGAGADFRGDAAGASVLASALGRFRPDAVVMSLASFTPRTEATAGPGAAEVELRALDALLAQLPASPVRTLVYLSSAGTLYGDAPGVADEATPTAPKSLYGRMKLEGERRIAAALEGSGRRWSALRVSNPYGPGQDPDGAQGVVAIFAGRLLRNLPCEVMTGSLRDYLFIDDLARAVVLSLSQPMDGPLNIASGVSVSAEALLRRIQGRLGRGTAERRVAPGAHEVSAVRLDASRAERLLGWRAEVGLDEGLDVTLAWVRERLGLA